eukprot:1194609-Prorocentrum_minimum.AAC.2
MWRCFLCGLRRPCAVNGPGDGSGDDGSGDGSGDDGSGDGSGDDGSGNGSGDDGSGDGSGNGSGDDGSGDGLGDDGSGDGSGDDGSGDRSGRATGRVTGRVTGQLTGQVTGWVTGPLTVRCGGRCAAGIPHAGAGAQGGSRRVRPGGHARGASPPLPVPVPAAVHRPHTPATAALVPPPGARLPRPHHRRRRHHLRLRVHAVPPPVVSHRPRPLGARSTYPDALVRMSTVDCSPTAAAGERRRPRGGRPPLPGSPSSARWGRDGEPKRRRADAHLVLPEIAWLDINTRTTTRVRVEKIRKPGTQGGRRRVVVPRVVRGDEVDKRETLPLTSIMVLFAKGKFD